MKKISTILLALSVVFTPLYAQKNPDTKRLADNEAKRTEIILPQVNGYNIYKADLHTHTIYSDGALNSKARVAEAYDDGLDIIAITDHLEWRTNEQTFLDYTRGYHKEAPKAKNHKIHREPADEDGILVDMNVGIKQAQKYAKRYGMLVIPGVEISRHPDQFGHFNALFIKDANKIYDPDIDKSFRKAKAQGAFIMHNHPGWRRKTCDRNEWQQKVYNEGLIDGVEIINGLSAWPKLLVRCNEENLFVGAGTDVHLTTNYKGDYFRTCTLVFAHECTLEAIKEAIEKRRTLAYGANHIMGDKQLLADLLNASLLVKEISVSSSGERTLSVTNLSSIPYHIRRGKKSGAGVVIGAFQTGTVKVTAEQSPEYYVLNMWYGEKGASVAENPRVLLQLDK
ncbi:MAG: PHP domain-containing protein [Alistipes sp.]|nr:PHP domain-containing protein [Alistipes sp.]